MTDYPHGGDIFSYINKYGQEPIDFSANVNPVPLPENIKKAYVKAYDKIGMYPDYKLNGLRHKILLYENIIGANIAFGSGASDIIYRIFHTLKPWKTLITPPTFSQYEKAAQTAGCQVDFLYLTEKNNFCPTEDLVKYIDENQISAMVVCNPNNPVGKFTDENLMEKIVLKCKEKDVLLIIDECFADFAPEKPSYKKYMQVYDNIIIIKAFTKVFAMAGLRLGYAFSPNKQLIDKINDGGTCWAVSTPAGVCGEAILDTPSYLPQSIHIINQEKKFLIDEMMKLPLKIYGYDANFIFFQSKILDLAEKIEKKGIMIRDCANFRGLKQGYYRIGVRLHNDNKKLIEALKDELTR